MEIEEVIKVIRALADGVNPDTGETLDNSAVCRLPQSIKALNRALSALVAQQDYVKRSPGNAGRAWSRREDQQVCEELRRGKELNEIAKAHDRTVPAIAARLVKLGKIAPAESEKSGPLFPEKVA